MRKPTSAQLSVRISTELYNKITDESEKRDISRTELMKIIIEQFFNDSAIIERINQLESTLINANFDTTSEIAGLTLQEKNASRKKINDYYQDEILIGQ